MSGDLYSLEAEAQGSGILSQPVLEKLVTKTKLNNIPTRYYGDSFIQLSTVFALFDLHTIFFLNQVVFGSKLQFKAPRFST